MRDAEHIVQDLSIYVAKLCLYRKFERGRISMSQNRVAGKDNSNSHNGPGDGRLSTAGKKRTRTGCVSMNQ